MAAYVGCPSCKGQGVHQVSGVHNHFAPACESCVGEGVLRTEPTMPLDPQPFCYEVPARELQVGDRVPAGMRDHGGVWGWGYVTRVTERSATLNGCMHIWNMDATTPIFLRDGDTEDGKLRVYPF